MALIMVFAFCNTVAADEFLDNEPVGEFWSEDTTAYAQGKIPDIQAQSGIVMDAETGRILYEKNAYVRRPMASTTKIMTAILAIEKGNLEDIVTVSQRAASVGGSDIGLKKGDRYTLWELLLGMMLNSGNDAAIAIAEHIGGTLENFVDMMNKRAAELGAFNTSFKSPHGLDAPGHYSTAYDLAVITRHALKNPTFSRIVAMTDASARDKNFHNTNEMLHLYPGTDGVKTGYTGKAGRCLVTSATRNGMRLISVVLNCPSRSARAKSSKTILDYAFENYRPHTLVESGEVIGFVRVEKGITETIPLKAAEEIRLPMTNDEIANLMKFSSLPEKLVAPVQANIPVGRLTFVVSGREIASTMVITAEQSMRKDFNYYLRRILSTWLKLVKLLNVSVILDWLG